MLCDLCALSVCCQQLPNILTGLAKDKASCNDIDEDLQSKLGGGQKVGIVTTCDMAHFVSIMPVTGSCRANLVGLDLSEWQYAKLKK